MRHPSYAKAGTKMREFCKKHAPKDYMSVQQKTCIHPRCEFFRTFGKPGSKVAEYCKLHALHSYVDVVHRKCPHIGCGIIPTFGRLFGQKLHCEQHKSYNEYRHNKPTCEIDGCKIRPYFTDKPDGYPLRCEQHQLANDKNVVERKCATCGLDQFILEGNVNCNDCADFVKKKPHKAKEIYIGQVLEAANFSITQDRIPDGSCFKYRPDFIIEASAEHIIIVEVDENQHQSYACECEQARMINLFQDFGGLKVVFVRYNPDAYVNNLGNKIKSTAGRDNKLVETVKALIMHPPEQMLTTVYLYYDGYDGQNKLISLQYGM